MSGGSFDYLFCKDAEELTTQDEVLERMAAELIRLGYAEDAARETEELLCIVRQFRVRANVRADRLSEVWRAVEYWRSGDYSEDSVTKALEAYRDR